MIDWNILGRLHRRAPFMVWLMAAGSVAIVAFVVAFAAWGPKRFVCTWALVLPSTDPEARVSLGDGSQAHAGARTLLDGRVLDHRENYRQMLLGPTVLHATAAALDMPVSALPRPRVRLLDQSSIFSAEVRAEDPQVAFEVATELLAQFQVRLESLREDEVATRRRALQTEVARAGKALEASSERLSDLRSRTGLVSKEQLDVTLEMLGSVEAEMLQRASQVAGRQAELDALGAQLGVDLADLPRVFALLDDGLFFELAEGWKGARGELAEHQSLWGPNHPSRLEILREIEGTEQELRGILAARFGDPAATIEPARLFTLLGESSGREVVHEARSAYSELEALRQELGAWRQSKTGLEQRLDHQVSSLVELEVLQAKNDLDQALLGSTLAQADIGRLKPFASYPLAQIFEAPRQPETPVEIHPILLAVAALAASGLWCVGVLLATLEIHRSRADD